MPLNVMPGLVPGIHALLTLRTMTVDAGIGERSDAVLRTACPAMTLR